MRTEAVSRIRSVASDMPRPGIGGMLLRGAAAGVAGSVVMTAFQKFVEMPLNQRDDSYQPAEVAEKLLRIRPRTQSGRTRLNYAAHFSLGAMWGLAYGVAAYRGLRGREAVAWVFPAIYANDMVTISALGIDEPTKWSREGATIDVADKFVQVAATSFIFDHFLDPQRRR